MSSPIFDQGTGKRFAQRVLDNLLFGINIVDERSFQKNVHVCSSILNVLLQCPMIALSYVPQTLIIFIISISISVVVSLIYLIFSFLPKERESQKVNLQIPTCDQFYNSLLYCHHTVLQKLVLFVLNSCIWSVFYIALYFKILHPGAAPFVAMLHSPAVRMVDSSMACSRPVSWIDPSLSNLFYVGIFALIGYGNRTVGTVLLSISPLVLTFGHFPHLDALLLFLSEIIPTSIGIPVCNPVSIIVTIGLVVSYVLDPIVFLVLVVSYSILNFGYGGNLWIKIAMYSLLALAGVVSSGVIYGMDSHPISYISDDWLIKYQGSFFMQKWWSIVCLAPALLFLPAFIFARKKQNLGQQQLTGYIVYNFISYVPALLFTATMILQYLILVKQQSSNMVLMYINAFLVARSIGLAFTNPLASLFGYGVGGIFNFLYSEHMRNQLCSLALNNLIGSWCYNFMLRFISITRYYQLVQKQVFEKNIERGWQANFKKYKCILDLFNGLSMLFCSFLNMTCQSIGGIPFFLGFYPHCTQFFTSAEIFKLFSNKASKMDNLQEESIENKDDIVIYNSSVSQLNSSRSTLNKQLRVINLINGQMNIGDIQFLMSEKKMLFLQCTGYGIFKTSYQYDIKALETVETSCHTLERTCIERYYNFIQQKAKENLIQSDQLDSKEEVVPAIPIQSDTVTNQNIDQSQIKDIKRRAPITLGQHNRNYTETEEGQKPSRPQNRLPKNIPDFNQSWMPKYQGQISSSSFETHDYSLSGMFTSTFMIEQLQNLFLGILYIQTQKQIGTLQQYGKSESVDSEMAQKCQSILRGLGGMSISPKVQSYVNKILASYDFELVRFENEDSIAKYYVALPAISENNSNLANIYSDLARNAFRWSCYIAIQVVAAGDDLPATLNDIQDQLDSYHKILLSTPSEPKWNLAIQSQEYQKIFSISEGPRVLEYSFQLVSWQVFYCPRYFYHAIWSSVQTDQLVFNSADDERFAVQSLPSGLRNLFCESACSPFGYPLVNFGQVIV